MFRPRFTQNKEEYKVPHERRRQDYSHKPGKTARSSFQIALLLLETHQALPDVAEDNQGEFSESQL